MDIVTSVIVFLRALVTGVYYLRELWRRKVGIPCSETGLVSMRAMCADGYSTVAQGNLDWCITGGLAESRLGREYAWSSARLDEGVQPPNSNFLSLSSAST